MVYIYGQLTCIVGAGQIPVRIFPYVVYRDGRALPFRRRIVGYRYRCYEGLYLPT